MTTMEDRISQLEAELQRLRAPRGAGDKFERDTYYRRPDGWITVGPTLSGTAARDFAKRGFVSLEGQFGTIPHTETNRWRPILSHRDGPVAFPKEQVLELRWHTEPPIPDVKFPQIKGMKIVHYKCPECESRVFPDYEGRDGVSALARHLTIIHRWDRMALQRYGDSAGIDFTRITASTEIVTEWADAAEGCDECDFVPPEDSKDAKASLRMHKMKAHPDAEVVTVG